MSRKETPLQQGKSVFSQSGNTSNTANIVTVTAANPTSPPSPTFQGTNVRRSSRLFSHNSVKVQFFCSICYNLVQFVYFFYFWTKNCKIYTKNIIRHSSWLIPLSFFLHSLSVSITHSIDYCRFDMTHIYFRKIISHLIGINLQLQSLRLGKRKQD